MPTFANYMNGEWVENGKTFENRNPATGELVGLHAKGSAADIEHAASAAAAALPAWSSMPAPARGAILFKAAGQDVDLEMLLQDYMLQVSTVIDAVDRL